MTTEGDAAPDAYEALAGIYDPWQERYGLFSRLVLPRLEETLARTGGDSFLVDSFLDLGCGTGTLILAMAERHPSWRLCGVDASVAMLARAKAKAGADTIGWIHARFDDLPPLVPFAVVGAFFDALNHAAAEGAFAGIAASVSRVLAPGGTFVFDLNNQLGFEAWWSGERVYAVGDRTLRMIASFDPKTALAQGTAIVESPDGTRHITRVVERCFSDDEVERAIARAGLKVTTKDAWSPMPNDVPGKTWWVAQKQA